MTIVGAGLAVPEEITRVVQGGAHPYVVEMTLKLRDGQYVCRSIQYVAKPDGPPVTTQGISRTMPVDELVRETDPPIYEARTGWPIALDSLDFKRLRRYGPTEETLLWAATLYAIAFLTKRAPLQYVARELGVSRATAARWIKRAREQGLMPEDLKRRPDIEGA